MRKLLFLALFAVVALSGCMSTGFLGFLATTDSVNKLMADQQAKMDQKIADEDSKVSGELNQQRADVAQISSDLKEFQDIKTQAMTAIDSISTTQKNVEELQALVKQLESRMGTLPDETLQRIIDVLQASLNRKAQ
jgi:outer membrane murein-binding lipoprotein Lpp